MRSEIQVVRLLNAKGEVELAKSMEGGRLIARLQREALAGQVPQVSIESTVRD